MTFIRVVPELLLAHSLYHEVGHHLDSTIGSASRTGEAAAEDWRRRLTRIHTRRRYWYLLPMFVLIRMIFRLLQRSIDQQISDAKRRADE